MRCVALIEVIRIQEALQKRCEGTGLRQFQIWAVEHCDGKRFDGGKQHCCSGTENSRITICSAIWLRRGFEIRKNVY